MIKVFEHQFAPPWTVKGEDDGSESPKHAAKTPRDSRLHVAAINDTTAQR
jgi:hypothetical protein